MPAEERVRKVNPGLLAHVLHEYGCNKIPVKLDLYEIRNVIYGTTVNPGVIEMLNGNIVEMIGVPLLLKKRTGMVPLLPLGDYMIKSCSHKVILPDKIIEKVLYGKPVIVKEVYNFRRALLVDGYNDFVAFVTLRRRNRGTEIIPVLDIGWYLRGGG